MAIVSLNINCGCGVIAHTIEEAVKHADESKHTLSIAGSIRSSERKVRKASLPVSTSPRPRRRVAVASLQVQAEEEINFDSLRTKLGRK